MSASWLRDAVFYEIYPQSFRDSNGDGIGDLPGITEKLPYVKSLGCNALWINPCFDSPFKDAGYDVTDHIKVVYQADSELSAAIEAGRDFIMKSVLADELTAGEAADGKECDINGKKAGLSVQKA